MSNEIPSIIPSENPDSYWASKVNTGVQSNSSIKVPDFLHTRDSKGMSLSLKRKHKPQNEFIKWGGELNAVKAYDFDEVVRVLPGSTYLSGSTIVNASVGTWRCCCPVPPGDYYHSNLPAPIVARYQRNQIVNYAPVFPEPTTVASPSNVTGRYWEQIGGAGSAQRFHLKEVYGDYVLAQSWNGTNEASASVAIAKPYKLRESITAENKLGTVFTYTYADTIGSTVNSASVANNRTRTGTSTIDPTNTENEMVLPLWLTPSGSFFKGDEVLAIQCNCPDMLDASQKPVSYIMIGPDRQWAVV